MTASPHPGRFTRRIFRTRVADERGAVLPLVALLLPVLVLMTAFAVDLGSQRDARRTMQARADLISLDLVREVNERTACELVVGYGVYAQDIEAELQRSAARNEVPRDRIVGLQWGHWDSALAPDGFVAHHDPDVPPDPLDCDAYPIPNAVQVLTHDTVDYQFQPGTGEVNRAAVANEADFQAAEFLVGSKLVSVTPQSSWLLRGLLQRVIPEAELVSYNGLANTEVELWRLAAALQLGSTQELVDADVTFRRLVLATADALDPQEDAAAITALNQMASLGVEDVSVSMGDVLGAGTTDPEAGFSGWVGVPQLLAAAVLVAHGDHAISVPGTELLLPGVLNITVEMSAIDPPIRVGVEDGASGTTKQFDVRVTASLDVSSAHSQRVCELPSGERNLLAQLIGGLLSTVNCLLFPLTSAVLDVRLSGDVVLDTNLARVTAEQRIDCPAETLTVHGTSDPLSMTITPSLAAAVTFNGSPLQLLAVAGQPTTLLAGGYTDSAVFDAIGEGPRYEDFEWQVNGAPSAQIGSHTLGLSNLTTLGGVQITIANQNLPVLGGIARNRAQNALNTVAGQIDQHVFRHISQMLGLNLGGADITPQWMACDKGIRLVR